EFIYPVDENNIFLGGEKGFFHINYQKYKTTLPDLQVQIRTVRIVNKTDSLLFGGYFNEVNEKQVQDAAVAPQINDAWKTIRFEFSAALFGYQSNLEYSYRLKGFNENWSEWTTRTEKEYTNLPSGDFTFEVMVRSNLGNESAIAGYAFKMLPPWYRTVWANLFYFLLFCAAILGIYKWQKIKFKKQEVKHEEEQKRLLYIHELELNKTESEIVALRNDNLEAEINFKNSELASSAMHLVKKGELLTKIKAELAHVMKGFDNPQAIAEIKKMIKSLGEDDNIDKEWESFTKHFDKVHSDFVAGLKDKHPAITSNELKLSAYLRMNLSTKEIAQLMNISVRGVEISRYRLRKKLGISSETNLFDYLISLNSKA
ncbi:triple tyrosine motif-containing protein, partial [Ferruginibacter sp.]